MKEHSDRLRKVLDEMRRNPEEMHRRHARTATLMVHRIREGKESIEALRERVEGICSRESTPEYERWNARDFLQQVEEQLEA